MDDINHKHILKTADEPSSKAGEEKILCRHYDGIEGSIVPGYCYSKLVPISKNECICSECGKRFPIRKYAQMEKLVKYLSNLGCVRDVKYFIRYAKLSRGLEPVYYRRLSETETEILETITMFKQF